MYKQRPNELSGQRKQAIYLEHTATYIDFIVRKSKEEQNLRRNEAEAVRLPGALSKNNDAI